MVTYSSDVTEPYDYETTATYQCVSGYELTGGDTVRTCTGDGSSPVSQWNGTVPVCTGKDKTQACDKTTSAYVTSLVTLDCYCSYSGPQEHTHSFTMCHLEETELRMHSNTDNDVSPYNNKGPWTHTTAAYIHIST